MWCGERLVGAVDHDTEISVGVVYNLALSLLDFDPERCRVGDVPVDCVESGSTVGFLDVATHQDRQLFDVELAKGFRIHGEIVRSFGEKGCAGDRGEAALAEEDRTSFTEAHVANSGNAG